MSEKATFKSSIVLPIAFVILLWIIHLLEFTLEIRFAEYMAIKPRSLSGAMGIITFPLVHGDWGHLASNSVPLLVLGTAIFYFYRPIALKVIGLIYLLHGGLVFLAARPVYHIGASGLVYGFAAFLFVSGVIRRERSLMALSMLVIFLYGGMIWGVLPIREGVSWEGHLFGALAGIFCAVLYKDQGPQKKKYSWEEKDDLPDQGIWDYRTHFPPPKHPDEEG